jgi:uncharacterized protein (TIGR03118 family)
MNNYNNYYDPTSVAFFQQPFVDPSINKNFISPILISTIGNNADPTLLIPWGCVIVNCSLWVCSTPAGRINNYTLLGVPTGIFFNISGPDGNLLQPTGIAHNRTSNFKITRGPLIASSSLIIVTREGTIHGYNADLIPTLAPLLLNSTNNIVPGVYTSVIVTRLGFMHVTDFTNRQIITYDGDMTLMENFYFIDEDTAIPIPDTYGPNNIVEIDDRLIVSWAEQQADDIQYEMPGIGKGFISIFDLDGTFIRRLCSGGLLNIPWGICRPPSYYGYPSGCYWIGNYGNGIINVYLANGEYFGSVCDCNQNQLCFQTLRSLSINPLNDEIVYWTGAADFLRIGILGAVYPR